MATKSHASVSPATDRKVVAFSASAPTSRNASKKKSCIGPASLIEIVGDTKNIRPHQPWEYSRMPDEELAKLPLSEGASIRDLAQRRRWELTIIAVKDSRVLSPDVREHRRLLVKHGPLTPKDHGGVSDRQAGVLETLAAASA